MFTGPQVKASARKSNGVYKPVLRHANGKTQVLERPSEHFNSVTRDGTFPPSDKFAIGATYANRAAAIEAAQGYLDRMVAQMVATLTREVEMFAPSERAIRYCSEQVAYWKGAEV